MPTPDMNSPLLEQRTIVVNGEIDDAVANVVTAQLLFLQFENKTKPVQLRVSSHGGSVVASLAIYDTMQFLKCPIATCATGQVAGTALLLLIGGTRGERSALPHARLQFVPLTTDSSNDTKEDDKKAAEVARLKKALYDIFAKHTGQPLAGIEQAHEERRTLSAQEAVEQGLIDRIAGRA